MAAFAMTETDAGSDVAAMKTTARRDGGDYVLDGTKTYISNAGLADFYTVFAATDPAAGTRGISCFLVPAETPGLRFAGAQVMAAPHPLGDLELDGCRLPATALLGPLGGGFKLGMRTLDRLRPTVAAAACGMGARALAEALALPRSSGVLVRDVVPGGPAEAAGLAIGDVILRVDDKPLDNARQFQVALYRKTIGAGVVLDVMRGDRPMRCVPFVRERPGDPASLAQLVAAGDTAVEPLGILALDLDPVLLLRLPKLRARAGVVVAAGTATAAFSDDPLQPGDVIYTLDGESITSVASLRERLRAREGRRPIVLQVERDGELRYVAVEAGGGPSSSAADAPPR
jgi:hypothetical protein